MAADLRVNQAHINSYLFYIQKQSMHLPHVLAGKMKERLSITVHDVWITVSFKYQILRYTRMYIPAVKRIACQYTRTTAPTYWICTKCDIHSKYYSYKCYLGQCYSKSHVHVCMYNWRNEYIQLYLLLLPILPTMEIT